MTIQEIRAALLLENVIAWLRVLREGESNQNEDAFTELYGGGHFDGFGDHPRKHFPLPDTKLTTSAAGAYQITETTWNDFTAHYGQMPFTPENQGACAVWLTNRAGALDDVLAGRIHEAAARCAKTWTSLAIGKRQAEAPQIFTAYGGTVQPKAQGPEAIVPQVLPAQPVKAKSMGVLAAFLPSILQMLPQLVSVFGSPSDSEVAKRNQAAGVLVTQALVEATKGVNLQDAVDKMTSDPAALSAAHDAINELLPQLMDVGGGVESARKFAADHENGRYGRILEVVTYCAMFFLLLANCLAFAVGWFKEDWSIVSTVIQADIGSALIAFGYFLGSSISSKRKDEMKGAQ